VRHVSYDLHLLKKDEIDDDHGAVYQRLEEQEQREPTPEEEQRLRQLAAELQAANPGVDLVESGKGFFLQLGYEAERTVVIDIGAGDITLSWSYGADDAAPALDEVRRYLPVFDRHGYVAYDQQLERLFDADRDAADAAEIHRNVQQQLRETYGPQFDERRPWWKRLFGGSRS
jgi:hypothetical protein